MKTSITAYSLAEFCKNAQEAILDGYRFDFDTNENYPQAFGSYYEVVMLKTEKPSAAPEASKQENPAPTDEAAEPKVKRGPKPKVSAPE